MNGLGSFIDESSGVPTAHVDQNRNPALGVFAGNLIHLIDKFHFGNLPECEHRSLLGADRQALHGGKIGPTVFRQSDDDGSAPVALDQGSGI